MSPSTFVLSFRRRSSLPLLSALLCLVLYLVITYELVIGHGGLPARFLDSFGVFVQPAMRTSAGVTYVDRLQIDRHPIEELLAQGHRDAEAQRQKVASVKTLQHAVDDYVAAYKMQPPEGFDAWYNLTLELGGIPVPSLIPLAVDTVMPFLALPPPLLRQRAWHFLDTKGAFGFEYHPKAQNPEDRIKHIERRHHPMPVPLATEWKDVLPHIERMPESQQADLPVMLPVWTDDVSRHPPSAQLLAASRLLVRAGKVWEENELLRLEEEEGHRTGWGNACSPRLTTLEGHRAVAAAERVAAIQSSFVQDPALYADPCLHPEHLIQNGELIQKSAWHVQGLIPLASLNSVLKGQPTGGGEITGPTTINTKQDWPLIEWKDKTDNRLYWRGNPNSVFVYDEWDWRNGQRFRLSRFAEKGWYPEFNASRQLAELKVNSESDAGSEAGISDGALAATTAGADPFKNRYAPLMSEQDGVLDRETRERDTLREAYLDVSLVNDDTIWPCGGHNSEMFYCYDDVGTRRPNCPGNQVECRNLLDSEYQLQRKTKARDALKYKFLIDIDGFGWTSRWRQEMQKMNVVIKISLYPEWWTKYAIPWYHYIPARYDFSDLFDIMAFFTGSPEEKANPLGITNARKAVLEQRDKIAENMAYRGRAFSLERLRWADMEVYTFLLLLEYRRAWSNDRQAATFQAPNPNAAD